ncbi:MAG: hypothetical protein OEY74_00080 [Gammaproteobacteria bacterium]|nr:hypothetical protein [Gammaproteobacteria bacterium]
MKYRHLINKGATTAALAMILGIPAAHAAEVYLQAEQYQKTIEYGGAASSRTVAVVNAGFETPNCNNPAGGDPGCPNALFSNGSFDGWTVTGEGGVFEVGAHAPATLSATEGDQVAYSNGGTLSQVLTEVVTAGTSYTLMVDVGDRNDTGFPGYSVSLYAGGALLAEENSLSLTTAWDTSTVNYTVAADNAAIGQPLEIRLQSAGSQTEFDNVRLEAAQTAAVVTMWGYSECSDATFSDCTVAAAASPGPQITVPAGDAAGLTIYLRNTLPEATSLMIAGQRPAVVTVNGLPATDLGRNLDGRLRSFAPEVPGAVGAPTAALAVTNAGFELPDCDLGGPDCPNSLYTTGTATGWTVAGGGVFEVGAYGAAGIAATEGDQDAYISSGSMSQLLTDVLTAGTTYTLMVDVGDRADAGFPGYAVALYAGGALLAQENSQVLTTEWGTSVVEYTATGAEVGIGQPLEIRLQSSGSQTQFDNVRLTASTGSGTVSVGTYSWPASDLRPGSYLYQSGSHVQLQVQMGLYGAMVQDAQGCTGGVGCAYSDVSYDAQQVLLLSEIDPALHDPMPTPANATVSGYVPRFFLINGAPFDGTLPPALAPAGDDILLRVINAGLDNHALQLMGGYFEVLGEDGHRAPTSKSQFNALLPPAKSLDLLFAPTAAGTYALFDRRLRLSNGPVDGGGMLHQVVVE